MGVKNLLGRSTEGVGKYPEQHDDRSRRAVAQRSITPEVSPFVLPSKPSDELAGAIQTCISEIATMWLLHRFSLAEATQSEPLDRQVANFSTAAFRAIKRFQILRSATQRHLWLIYFKGLLTAGVPAREQMLQAIRSLEAPSPAQTSNNQFAEPTGKTGSRFETITNSEQGKLSDSEALEQIERALAQT